MEETNERFLTNSWSSPLLGQLNLGEWDAMTVTESTSFPPQRFYRAVAE